MVEPAQRLAPQVQFRMARPADIPDLQQLYGQLIPDESPSLTDMRATLERILSDHEHGQIVIADLDGQVVGTCQLIVYDNLIRTPRKKAVIDSVVVRDGYRRRGIGTAMMTWCVAELRRRQCSKVAVSAAFFRTEAHGMYAKLGFEQAGYTFATGIVPRGTGA